MERLSDRWMFYSGMLAAAGVGVDDLKRIQNLIDAEEQGLLLRLPCKVGDVVYRVWYKPCHKGEEYPDSYTCCECEDECYLKKDVFEFIVPDTEWILKHLKYFGDYVWFLTKEEAEAALEKMKGEEHE